MAGYTVRLVLPGRRAPDPFDTRVEIVEDGTAWPIVFHFLRVEEDDGSQRFVNVGFELRRAVAAIDENTAPEDVPEIDPEVLERIALSYPRYLRAAQGVLEWDQPNVDLELARLRRAGRTRRGLSKEFFRRIAADYEAQVRNRGKHGAVAAIARANHANPSTASRWIRRARELGFIESTEEANNA